MDKIFGFVALRRPSQEAPRSATLAGSSDFQQQLARAAAGANTLADVTAAAQRFADGGGMLTDVDAAYRGRAFLEMYERLANRSGEDATDLASEVRGVAGQSRPADWATDATRARDTILAAYLLEQDGRAATAVKLLRAYAVADAVFTAGEVAAAEAALHAPFLLPDYLLELRTRPASDTSAAPSPDEIATALISQFQAARERHSSLTQALVEIGSHDEDELVLDELGERRPLASLYETPARPAERLHLHAEPAQAAKKPAAPAVSGGSSPLRRAAARTNVTLSETGVRLLSEPSRKALQGLGLDPAAATIQEMQQRVASAHEEATQELRTLAIELSRLIS